MKPNRAARLTPRLLALIPVAAGINLAMGKLALATNLPVFLDTIGTVLVAALAGPAAAVSTGLVSQVALTMVDGRVMLMAFLPVQLGVALLASWAARRGGFRSLARAAATGVGVGIVAATMSWPIALLVFGGVTAGGVTLVTAALRVLGLPLTWAVYAASLSNDVLDKTATFLVVRSVLISLPRRIAARFPMAARAVGSA